jgi:hypothetical protein
VSNTSKKQNQGISLLSSKTTANSGRLAQLRAKQSSTKVPAEVHASFAKLHACRIAAEGFKTANAKILDHYEALRGAYNEALKEAEAVFAANKAVLGDSYDDFKWAPGRRRVDTDLLLTYAPDMISRAKVSFTLEDVKKAVKDGIITEEIKEDVIVEGESTVKGPAAL